MSKDEARKLLGGYATGSLTEAERTALFQAALEDQKLFDELAGEQVLKEVLDEPGARQRLLAALESGPHRTGWWMRPWPWATAAATVAVAVVIGIVISQRTPPPPQQLAEALTSPEPANAPSAPPSAAPPPVRRQLAPVPPPAAALAPAPPPPPELKKEKEADAAVTAQADQLQQAKPQAAAGAVREFAASRVASVFAFNYSLGADGFLEVTPTAQGFLSVTAGDATVFPSTAVNGGMAVRITIPAGATSLVIRFSRTQGITGTAVRRDAASGTVTDQDPPNGKILIELSLTPAPR